MGARSLVISERLASPCATLETIGKKTGVTRQRVDQILKDEGLPTRHQRQTWLCNYCRKVMSRNRLFCSTECFHEYHYVWLACEECGCLFSRKLSQVRHTLTNPHGSGDKALFFCTKRCKSRHAGKYYGIGSGYQKSRRLQ